MADPTANPSTNAPQVELSHDAQGHPIVEGIPDLSGAEWASRAAHDAIHQAAPVVAPVAEVPVDVSATTDPHRDYTSATGQNDSSHSDSPISAEHDAPVEAASDPVPETPPEEPKHEDPPAHEPDPAPEAHHEPAAADPAPTSTEGTEGHHD